MKWLADLDYQRWDKQLEKDIADGKLEVLAQEAISDYETGHCMENKLETYRVYIQQLLKEYASLGSPDLEVDTQLIFDSVS